MNYFNENANPWLPMPGLYGNTPLTPPDNSEQRVASWKAFAEKLSANFKEVVRERDEIIRRVVDERDVAYAQREAWKKMAVELRNQHAPDLTNEQLNAAYNKKKAEELKSLEQEKLDRSKSKN